MKRFMRLPSPALVVALVALFVALGGVSYGLATGSIDSREIKNRTITTVDMKGRSLKGTLMQKESVGYNAVKEQGLDASKFKKVKSAATADTAGTRVNSFTLDSNQSQTVLREGPFVLTARCRVEGPNQIAEVVIQTNQSNSAVDGAQKDTDLDVGETVQLVAASGPAGTPSFDQEPAGAAIAPDGTEILGQEMYAGTSVLGQTNKCRFGGSVYAG